jgi:hypothetical protein
MPTGTPVLPDALYVWKLHSVELVDAGETKMVRGVKYSKNNGHGPRQEQHQQTNTKDKNNTMQPRGIELG